MKKLLLVGLCAAFALSSPSTAVKRSDPRATAGPVIDATTAAGPDADRYAPPGVDIPDYQLGTGDKVRVTVFNEPTLSGEFAVGADGQLSLPLIGNVPANNKRTAEVAAEVQTALANGFLRNPQVSAEVTTYRPFFILGEVKLPGQYPYTVGLTAYNAIATAQGYTPRAERRNIFIRRANEGQEERFKLSPNLRVLPGDTIRIGERYF